MRYIYIYIMVIHLEGTGRKVHLSMRPIACEGKLATDRSVLHVSTNRWWTISGYLRTILIFYTALHSAKQSGDNQKMCCCRADITNHHKLCERCVKTCEDCEDYDTCISSQRQWYPIYFGFDDVLWWLEYSLLPTATVSQKTVKWPWPWQRRALWVACRRCLGSGESGWFDMCWSEFRSWHESNAWYS